MYTVGLFAIPEIRRQYSDRYGKQPLVPLQDLSYTTHIFVLSIVLVIQAAYYRRKNLSLPDYDNLDHLTWSNQGISPVKVSLAAKVFFTLSFLLTLFGAFLCSFSIIQWLDWVRLQLNIFELFSV